MSGGCPGSTVRADKGPGSLVSPESSFGTLCETRSLPEAPAICPSSSVPPFPPSVDPPRTSTSYAVPTGPHPHRVTSSGHRVPTIPSVPETAAQAGHSHDRVPQLSHPFPLHPTASSTAQRPVPPHSQAARGPTDQGWRGEVPPQSIPPLPLYRPPKGGDSRPTEPASEGEWNSERGSEGGQIAAPGIAGEVERSAAGCVGEGDGDSSESHGPVEIDPGVWSPTTSRASSGAWRSCGSLSEHVAGPAGPPAGCPRAFVDRGYPEGAAGPSRCRPCEHTRTFCCCHCCAHYCFGACFVHSPVAGSCLSACTCCV